MNRRQQMRQLEEKKRELQEQHILQEQAQRRDRDARLEAENKKRIKFSGEGPPVDAAGEVFMDGYGWEKGWIVEAIGPASNVKVPRDPWWRWRPKDDKYVPPEIVGPKGYLSALDSDIDVIFNKLKQFRQGDLVQLNGREGMVSEGSGGDYEVFLLGQQVGEDHKRERLERNVEPQDMQKMKSAWENKDWLLILKNLEITIEGDPKVDGLYKFVEFGLHHFPLYTRVQEGQEDPSRNGPTIYFDGEWKINDNAESMAFRTKSFFEDFLYKTDPDVEHHYHVPPEMNWCGKEGGTIQVSVWPNIYSNLCSEENRPCGPQNIQARNARIQARKKAGGASTVEESSPQATSVCQGCEVM